MNGLLEAICSGDLIAVNRRLADEPKLLNQADDQGNTPLHYAVTQQDLALIELLIQQGADIKPKNHQGETAADWYQEFITSTYKLEQLISSKELRQVIEKNDVQVVADSLKAGVSRSLRFLRGNTLLHLAIELQKLDIVKLILEGVGPETIKRLLNLKNSRGVTPLDLAKQFNQYNTLVGHEIFNYLQEKQYTAIPEKAESIISQLPSEWPFLLNKEFINKINELSNRLKHSITRDDFVRLNPLRVVLVKLAYVTCRQALSRLSTLETEQRSFSLWHRETSEKVVLEQLFGSWGDNAQLEFQKKLEAVVDYLGQLIQQPQEIERVIHFSNESAQAKGWHDLSEDRIYLNPTIESNIISLENTFIHELTHLIVQSYDFVTLESSLNGGGYTINFNEACQLASTGTANQVTPERTKVFEIWQLIQEGVSAHWQKNLWHWQALNNADTQTVAILALATLPEKYATVNSRRQSLSIRPQFLSVSYVEQHPTPPPLSPMLSPVKTGKGGKPKKEPTFGQQPKDHRDKLSRGQDFAGPSSPGSDSSASSGGSQSPPLSPSAITESSAAFTVTVAAPEQPGASTAAVARGSRGSHSFITSLFGKGARL